MDLKVLDSARSFRKENLTKAFYKSGLKEFLIQFRGASLEQIIENFKFKRGPLYRFLNACSFLEVVEKKNEKYYFSGVEASYTETLNEILFKFNRYAQERNVNEAIEEVFFTEIELESLISEEILEHRKGGIYVDNDYILQFDKEHPQNIITILAYYENILSKAYSVDNIINVLRTGLNLWQNHFDNKEGDPFLFYDENTDLLKDLLKSLYYINDKSNSFFLQEIKKLLPEVKSILDIGGSCGNFILNAEKTFDLEKAHIFEKKEAKTLVEELLLEINPLFPLKVEYIWSDFLGGSGEYLQDLNNHKYDLISMGYILHDWDDQVCVDILKRAVFHLNKEGRLVILEWILNEDKNNHVTLQDIDMLVETTGRERTLSEFSILLSKVNFKIEKVLHNPGNPVTYNGKKNGELIFINL